MHKSQRLAVFGLILVAMLWLAGGCASTPTATPVPTATPTPTPVGATAVGSVPAGQIIFGVQRAGQHTEEVWRITVQEPLIPLHEGVLAGGWGCGATAAGVTGCAFVDADHGLYAQSPLTTSLALLDEIAVDEAALPVPVIATPVSPTVSLSSSAALTGSVAVSMTLPLTATETITPTTAPALAALVNPTGDLLALQTAAGLAFYDLKLPAPLGVFTTTQFSEMQWSPDGQWLALVFPGTTGNAVALWGRATNQVQVLADMIEAGHVAWAPDSAKLAFDARIDAPSPFNQGGQSEVYVYSTATSEIDNMTEMFLRTGAYDPAEPYGAWRPTWQADSNTVRYFRGLADVYEEQNWIEQGIGSGGPEVVAAGTAEDAVPTLASADGRAFVRVQMADGRARLQTRVLDDYWQDMTTGTFAPTIRLAWQRTSPTSEKLPLLLAVDDKSLFIVDPASGQVQGLAVTCATCTVTRAVWLP